MVPRSATSPCDGVIVHGAPMQVITCVRQEGVLHAPSSKGAEGERRECRNPTEKRAAPDWKVERELKREA